LIELGFATMPTDNTAPNDALATGRRSARSRGVDKMFLSSSTMERPPLEPQHTAVVVVDMVNHQVTRGEGCLGNLEASGVSVGYIDERVRNTVIPAHQRLLEATRTAGGRVVYLRVGASSSDYADGLPVLQPGFRSWGAHDGSPACEVIADLAPQPGDVSLMKSGSGGFTTSALDSCLRNMGIRHVIYSGVVTNGCVLLTLAAGYDLGYHGYLASDATATFSPRLQAITEELVSGYMAEVLETEHLVGLLASGVD
jgi:nicotinamidase-related amidase